MDNHILKKSTQKGKIVYYDDELIGYVFKTKRANSLNVNEVTILKPSIIDRILTSNFKEKYKRLVMIVLSIIRASDTSEGDCVIALDEVARLKDILLHKYHNLIKKEKEAYFLQQLTSLEGQLHQKVAQIRAFKNMFDLVQEEHRMGR